MEAKYAGRSTVMQHGAKSAATPAMNAATIDAPSNNSIQIILFTKFFIPPLSRAESKCPPDNQAGAWTSTRKTNHSPRTNREEPCTLCSACKSRASRNASQCKN